VGLHVRLKQSDFADFLCWAVGNCDIGFCVFRHRFHIMSPKFPKFKMCKLGFRDFSASRNLCWLFNSRLFYVVKFDFFFLKKIR
jgi:hypothetical protein